MCSHLWGLHESSPRVDFACKVFYACAMQTLGISKHADARCGLKQRPVNRLTTFAWTTMSVALQLTTGTVTVARVKIVCCSKQATELLLNTKVRTNTNNRGDWCHAFSPDYTVTITLCTAAPTGTIGLPSKQLPRFQLAFGSSHAWRHCCGRIIMMFLPRATVEEPSVNYRQPNNIARRCYSRHAWGRGVDELKQ